MIAVVVVVVHGLYLLTNSMIRKLSVAPNERETICVSAAFWGHRIAAAAASLSLRVHRRIRSLNFSMWLRQRQQQAAPSAKQLTQFVSSSENRLKVWLLCAPCINVCACVWARRFKNLADARVLCLSARTNICQTDTDKAHFVASYRRRQGRAELATFPLLNCCSVCHVQRGDKRLRIAAVSVVFWAESRAKWNEWEKMIYGLA